MNIEHESSAFPSRTYARVVLEPAYDQAKQVLLHPMLAVNKAHLIMLYEQNIIRESDALSIASALRELDLDTLGSGDYNPQYEDLFFEIEHKLGELAGEIASNLHLARSRNDMGISLYRIVLRNKLLNVIDSGVVLHRSMQSFIGLHKDTIMIAHTHTQQAQPTTLAHYISAVSDSLERDLLRFKRAFIGCNHSSLGAAALTTSGFPVSRERVAELLGFGGIIENAYDAVSGADYVGEAAAVTQLAAINLGRFVQDLLLWCTQEFGILQVAAPYVQISSIMPQKRNPVSIEHARSLLSISKGNAETVLSIIHNTPFGDIVDTEDDLQPYAWKSLDTLSSVYELLAEVISTLKVNTELLKERAKKSFASVTELADTLVRTENLSFRKAHSIVSQIVTDLTTSGSGIERISWTALNDRMKEETGTELRLSPQQLEQAIDPVHFVRVRQLTGGPNRDEVQRSLEGKSRRLTALNEWKEDTSRLITSSFENLDAILSEWLIKA
ncbi:Argininosuccinate lyase 1 [compost metagenome]